MSAHRSFPSRRVAHAAIIGVLAVALTAVVGVAPASAATLTVSPGGTDNGCVDSTYTTISSAITCAANGDTITVAAGTYNERVVIDKNIAVIGAGAGQTIIDGQGLETLPAPGGQVSVIAPGDATLSDLSIVNPGATSPTTGHLAIYARGSIVGPSSGLYTFSGLAIDGGGLLPNGQGLYCFSNAGDNDHDVTVSDSTFTNIRGNHILMELCTGELHVSGSTFTQNLVPDGAIFSMRYAGITSPSPQTITDSTFTGANLVNQTAISYQGSFGGGSTTSGFSNIGISGNTFTGMTTGVNLQNNSTTPGTGGLIDAVSISGNTFSGAGVTAPSRAIRASGLVTNTTISSNTISSYGTGLLFATLESQTPTGTTVASNRIVGNTIGLDATGVVQTVDAERNWWGCNTGPGTAGCDTVVGNADFDPWLVLTFLPEPATSVPAGGSTGFGVSTRVDSDSVDGVGAPGTVALTAAGGGVTPASAPLVNGSATGTFLANAGPGSATLDATLDNTTITRIITVASAGGGGGGGGAPTEACPDGAPSAGFVDVNAGDTHTAAINCLVSLGIAKGKTATTYDPTAPVTRGQMASFVARAMAWAGVSLPAGPDAFDDDNGDVHEAAINQLAAAGLVNGTGARTYQPSLPLSRAQAASFVVRAYERVSGTTLPAPASGFTDIAGNVHETNINKAAAAGIVNGATATTFNPGGTTTRAQMASLIVRMLDGLVEGGFAP
jgi:hypothetical protein